MTREEITRMAREAGFEHIAEAEYWHPLFERFAALVAAEKEQQMVSEGYRKCASGQRTTQFCGLLDAAVRDERERCAQVCEAKGPIKGGEVFAARIRARSMK